MTSERKKSNYDCLIALSGGVESTALLHYVVNELKETPLCFHYNFQHKNKSPANSIRHIKKYYGVDCVSMHYHFDMNGGPCIDKDEFLKKNPEGFPDTSLWLMGAHTLAYHNPQIKKIYYGFNAGLFEPGDGEGDQYHPYAEAIIQPVINSLKVMGYDTEISCPISHFTKKDLWMMIPNELKPIIWTCVTDTNAKEQCGKCFKCGQLAEIKNYVDFNV